MKVSFELIKQIVAIISTGTNLGAFIVTTLCTKPKSENFVEYTDLSKFYLNIYIFCLLLLCFIHSINSTIICSLFSERLGIITSNKGKLILAIAIFTMFFCTDSTPQKLFGMISFVASLALFLAELLLNCDTLEQNPEKNEISKNSSNSTPPQQ